MEFLKSNITDEWLDLVNEFPEFILELSPDVEEWYDNALTKGYGPPNKSELCNLRYGFECGIGWKELIREYFTEMRALIEKVKSNGDEIIYKTFIFKEKFGTLTDQGDFYGKNRKEYWDEYVILHSKFSNKSLKVCEVCGKPGEMSKRGWYKVLCDVHIIDK